jgi:nucleotide-binding universal stress UspA family protein
MRILLAADDEPYSEYALGQLVNLAKNTWADVTILGIYPDSHGKHSGTSVPWPADLPVSKALRKYRDIFLKSWSREDSPYEAHDGQYEWISGNDGVLEEIRVFRGQKKEFKLRLRRGNPAGQIVSESAEEGTDLLILGCPKGQSCAWKESGPVPQGVVNDANCSVLVVKEEQPVRRILACLDQGYISQESLEIINQMITIHGAALELIGLSQDGEMNKDVYTRLIEVGDYYSDRDIEVKTRLADVSQFEKVIAEEAQQDLLALWMGKKSLLSRWFSRGWIGRFVSTSPSSVLVMR